MGIKIIGTGSYKPARILSNFEISKMVDTSPEWIESRTGIIERRIADVNESTSDMAVKAAEKALELSQCQPLMIDLIIVATVTPDTIFPSTAIYVQKRINANNAVCFDIQATCSGMIYGLEIIHSLMSINKKYKNVLFIGAEKLSSITNWKDRNTCILFGDAAGAIIFTNTNSDKKILLSSVLHSDGRYADLLVVRAGGTRLPLTVNNINNNLQYIYMEGNKIFKLAVNAMISSSIEALKESNIVKEEIKYLIPHQANIRIINAVGVKLGFPNNKIATNLHKYGNTSAASMFLIFDEYYRANKFSVGDKLLLTAFGGGMTWGSAIIEI